MEIPINMDDLGVPLFLETSISRPAYYQNMFFPQKELLNDSSRRSRPWKFQLFRLHLSRTEFGGPRGMDDTWLPTMGRTGTYIYRYMNGWCVFVYGKLVG